VFRHGDRMKLLTFALYGGPDQLMPITSGLATIFAFLLMFWNKLVGLFGKLVHRSRFSRAENDGRESLNPERTQASTPGHPEKR
jgi:hypothetical protein